MFFVLFALFSDKSVLISATLCTLTNEQFTGAHSAHDPLGPMSTTQGSWWSPEQLAFLTVWVDEQLREQTLRRSDKRGASDPRVACRAAISRSPLVRPAHYLTCSAGHCEPLARHYIINRWVISASVRCQSKYELGLVGGCRGLAGRTPFMV